MCLEPKPSDESLYVSMTFFALPARLLPPVTFLLALDYPPPTPAPKYMRVFILLPLLVDVSVLTFGEAIVAGVFLFCEVLLLFLVAVPPVLYRLLLAFLVELTKCDCGALLAKAVGLVVFYYF